MGFRVARMGVLAGVMVIAALRAHADEVPSASLFFSGDEVKRIEALTARNFSAHAQPEDVHLGAVLYYAPDAWTIWLQGKRWTPQTDSTDLHVVSVEPGLVHIHLAEGAEYFAHDIALKPHQTYQVSTGKIIEGVR